MESDDSFMFDDITAGRYKEFDIVKRNKFGMKQDRRMGIDHSKIYNMKRGSQSGFLQAKQVVTAEREIKTVKTIDFVKKETGGFFDAVEEEDDFRSLKIEFEEENGVTTSWDITTNTPKECAEIVAKIRYLQKKSKQKSMLAELSTRNMT